MWPLHSAYFYHFCLPKVINRLKIKCKCRYFPCYATYLDSTWGLTNFVVCFWCKFCCLKQWAINKELQAFASKFLLVIILCKKKKKWREHFYLQTWAHVKFWSKSLYSSCFFAGKTSITSHISRLSKSIFQDSNKTKAEDRQVFNGYKICNLPGIWKFMDLNNVLCT